VVELVRVKKLAGGLALAEEAGLAAARNTL
jgi:hypothetical protein